MFFETNLERVPHGIYDPFNETGKRSTKNVDKYDYNCGGYALGTFNWWGFYCLRFSGERNLEDCVEELLEVFPDKLRIITSPKECKSNEYVIAFRMSDVDFHFLKLSKNGRWYHKRGAFPKIEIFPKKDLFNKIWKNGSYYYDSEIVFFAMRR